MEEKAKAGAAPAQTTPAKPGVPRLSKLGAPAATAAPVGEEAKEGRASKVGTTTKTRMSAAKIEETKQRLTNARASLASTQKDGA